MFELNRKDSAAADSVAAERPRQPEAAQRPAATTAPRSGGIAVIGRSIQIRGDLRGDEDIRIEGDIQGSIYLPNHELTIGREGRVRADAYAKAVIIDGEIEGDVYGAECVAIRANARVMGNILASRVSLEEGARFKGSVDMDPQSVKRALDEVTRNDRDVESSRSDTADDKRNGADKPVSVAPEKPAKSTKADPSIPSP